MGLNISKYNPKVEVIQRRERSESIIERGKLWVAENIQHKHLLGKGPVSFVVQAVNIKTKQKCAMKVIEYNSREDPLYHYAIEKARKAYHANKIAHSNLVKTHVCQAVEVDNNFALKNKFIIIMELFDQNLKDLIIHMQKTERVFAIQQIMRFAFDLSRSLAAAHRQGLYHTNIKEENIFFAKKGHVKLGDFDIPINLEKQRHSKQLLAPELRLVVDANDETVDWGKVDCFGLGIVLIKIALREIVFKQDLPLLLERVSAAYGKKLEVIIKRLTAADPHERWSAERLFKYLQEDYMLQKNTEAEFDELLSEEQREVQTMSEKGLLYRKSGDHSLALTYFEKAKEMLMRTPSMNQYDRILMANCLHNTGIAYYETKDYPKALSNHLLCLDLKKKYLGGLDILNSYGNIGKIYSKLGDPQKGLVYYTKAYAAAKKTKGDARLTNMAKSLDDVACTYESLGDYQNALENHAICLELVGKAYGETSPRYGKTLRNIARVFKNLGRIEEAKVFELKAKKINH